MIKSGKVLEYRMINIKSYLKKRGQYKLRKSNCDEWVEKILKNDFQNTIYFVASEAFLYNYNKQRKDLEKKYHIAGVYDLGNPYLNTGIRIYLIKVTLCKTDAIQIGLYKGKTYLKYNDKVKCKSEFLMPEKYLDEYNAYISELELFIDDINTTDRIEDLFELKNINIEQINYEKLYPRYYSDLAINIRKSLYKNEHFKLKDVADIIYPQENKNSKNLVKVLKISDMMYPLNTDNVNLGTPTSVILKKGDILFPVIGNAKPYLYMNSTRENVYASRNTVIIRCKTVIPEYIFLYLLSETAQVVLESISMGVANRRILIKDLIELPIELPERNTEEYISDFNVLCNFGGRDYGNISRNNQILKYYGKNFEKTKKLEDILSIELANNIHIHNEKQLKSFLNEDLKELNSCYKVKAYKATLILAGSILEAVLIDWLSEIKGIDYFENDYSVKDKRTGKYRKANLCDYINEIKYIERPNWMIQADKAHEIRKKRNLVHAKLCLKSDDINEKVCQEVIVYLKDILKTRETL